MPIASSRLPDGVHAGELRGARGVEYRRVALAERDDVGFGGWRGVVEEGNQVAIAPDAALVDGCVAHAAFAPGFLERCGVELGEIGNGFEETAAFRAGIDDFGDGKGRLTSRRKARQMGLGHETFSIATDVGFALFCDPAITGWAPRVFVWA